MHLPFPGVEADAAGAGPAERSPDALIRLLEERTAELAAANAALRQEVEENRASHVATEQYQQQLRDMANALCLAGERERRTIAQSLHDHVGQALAFATMRLVDLRGNAVFCGFEDDIGFVLRLLDGSLRYTRDLTCELSPPRLYELGIDAALEWLVQHYRRQHKLSIAYRGCDTLGDLDEPGRVLLYAAARELLANAVRHARPGNIWVSLGAVGSLAQLRVRDDGCGFDPSPAPDRSRFGLFAMRERLRTRAGRLEIRSSPGGGTEALVEIPRAPAGPS